MLHELHAVTDYLNDHEVLVVQIDMSAYLIDYYSHCQVVAPNTTREQDDKLKDLIATFAIHLATRSRHETHGWTVHLIDGTPYVLYVTGDIGRTDDEGLARGSLVGTVLTQHIRHPDVCGFHAQVVHEGVTSRSYVACESNEIVGIVEAFYKQSEQRPIRVKISETSDTAIGLVALHGFDTKWFVDVDLDLIVSGLATMNTTRMRDCRFKFECRCSAEKLLPYFVTLSDQEIDELYGKDGEIVITCGRCGRQFEVDKAMIALAREKEGIVVSGSSPTAIE